MMIIAIQRNDVLFMQRHSAPCGVIDLTVIPEDSDDEDEEEPAFHLDMDVDYQGNPMQDRSVGSKN
ncbi:hypothetical protein LCGC14_1831810 [marine sediment metagenome]|uniref:Uncharacterized protein n=1 Tax=marine sediment metagenome TaxID=412755 RepID=A0A0F8Y289_9ZZZZ